MNLDFLDLKWINKQIAAGKLDWEGFVRRVHSPIFSVSQLGISRQELHYWKKNGLLPSSGGNNQVWTRISFFEYAWIKLVVELRQLNIPLETISALRENLMKLDDADIDSVFELFINQNANSGIDMPDKEDFIKFLKMNPGLIKEQLKNQFNEFIFLLIGVIVNRKTAYLLVKKNGDNSIMLLPETFRNPAFYAEYHAFIEESYVSIPLHKLLNDFLADEKIKPSSVQAIFGLTEKETIVLELLRKEGIKELRIRFNKKMKGELLIEVVEEKQVAIIKSKVEKLLAKGKVQDIRLYAEDGNLKFAEITNKIKLK